MQPRQRSRWVTSSSDIVASGVSPSPISTIRPRGESASMPHSTYVGQVSRQKPQWTQSSMTSCSGGRRRSNAVIGGPSVLAQMPPTNTPGLQVPAGSKRSLTAASDTAARAARGPMDRSARAPCAADSGRSWTIAVAPAGSSARRRAIASGSTCAQVWPSAARPTSEPPQPATAAITRCQLGRARRDPHGRAIRNERWAPRCASHSACRRRRPVSTPGGPRRSCVSASRRAAARSAVRRHAPATRRGRHAS